MGCKRTAVASTGEFEALLGPLLELFCLRCDLRHDLLGELANIVSPGILPVEQVAEPDPVRRGEFNRPTTPPAMKDHGVARNGSMLHLDARRGPRKPSWTHEHDDLD